MEHTEHSEHRSDPGHEQHHAPVKQKMTFSFSKKHLVFAGALLAFLFISPLALAALDVYAFNWNRPGLSKVASAFSYPAFSVDGRIYSYSEYETELENLERILQQSGAETSRSERQQMLIDRLKRAAAVKRLANEKQLDLDLTTKMATSMTFGDGMTREQIEEAVKENFNWSMDYFEQEVLVPFAREMAFALDVLKPQAEALASEVKAPSADFAKIAMEKGEDATKESGGDLGWFGRGAMVPEFEEQVFAMQKGEVSGPFMSRYGWHVVKVEDIKGEGEEQQVKARHIIVALKNHEAEIEPMVVEVAKDVKVRVFVKE